MSALPEFIVNIQTSKYLEGHVGAEEKNRAQRSPENAGGGGSRKEEGRQCPFE